MTNIENNKFPCWGQYPKNDSIFNYVHTKLDENIIPEIPDEDFRALSDFSLIYIYISPIQSDGRRFYYIGQTIDVSRRTKEHSEKLKKENYERFKEFINGEYIAFYGENISQNLNYIEKLLILTFVEEFNFLNFVNMNKEDGYVGKLLANKDRGNESGKNQSSREKVEKNVINNILQFLQENKLIDDKPNLKRVTSSLFAESPFFELTKNQNDILEKILKYQKKRIHLIKGGAGTGKTVLLLHLIARLKLERPNSQIAIFVRNIHRDRFKKILTSYGLKPDDNDIDIVTFNQLSKTDTKYDYIIIDSPPSLSLLTVNGMIASDYLLLPVQTEFYALEGVAQLLDSVKVVRKAMNPELKLLGVLATMYDKRTSLSVQVVEEIRKYFKDKIFKTLIPRNVRLAEAPSHGVPVGAYDPFSKGSRAYKDLAKEVMKRVEKEG